jgi:hypothetical protein
MGSPNKWLNIFFSDVNTALEAVEDEIISTISIVSER